MFVDRRWVAAGVLGAVLLAPALAETHAYLVRSNPTARAVITRSPPRVALWFNERLESRFSRLAVHDGEGRRADLGDGRVGPDPKQLSIDIPPLAPGPYAVRYRVLSVDGHVVEGEFPFTVPRNR